MNRLTTKFSIIFLGVTFALILLLVPDIVHAGFWETITNPAKLISSLFKGVSYVFAFLVGQLLVLGGALVHLMLDLNFKVLSDENNIVHVGWRIVRDIANLGFVLVIIIIAFATILRKEQYGVKKLLPKLIAAAILVNFSLVIAGVFIDFSNVVTNFFISKAVPSSEGGVAAFSSSLTNVFGPQRLFIEDESVSPSPFGDDEGGELDFGAAALIGITGLIFTVVFTLLAALVMFAFALMLFLRYLYLTFLAVLAPIVWLFWIFPALSGQWNKWWHKFLQWVFFAPAVSFFVYLALISVEQLGEVRATVIQGNFFTGTLSNIMLQGVQMIVLAGILIAGLIIAQQMGIKGAAGAINIASKAGKGARAWAGRRALQTGTYPLRGVVGRKATEGLQRVGTGEGGGFIRKSFRNVGKFTGVNALLRQTGQGLSEARITGEQLSTQTKKEVRGRSVEENRRRFAAASNPEKVEIIASFRDQSKSNNQQIKQAATEALSLMPQDALTKDIRLSFLYGRGGEAGTAYGIKIPFMEPRIIQEARPETRPTSGIGDQVEEMIEQEATKKAAPLGGTPGTPGTPGAPGGGPTGGGGTP